MNYLINDSYQSDQIRNHLSMIDSSQGFLAEQHMFITGLSR